MVVRSWNYSTPNWIYVVLSRVRTLKRLHICEKLIYTQRYQVDKKLLKEGECLRGKEQELIKYHLSSIIYYNILVNR